MPWKQYSVDIRYRGSEEYFFPEVLHLRELQKPFRILDHPGRIPAE